jgi:hypothetical protein
MTLTDYIVDVRAHPEAHAQPVNPKDHQQLQKEGLDLSADHEALLLKKEHVFVLDCLNSRAVPNPHLLIKDHKEIDSRTGRHPTHLVVSASNFASAFPKLGYLAIKKIFDTHRINYTSRQFPHACAVKQKLQSLDPNPNDCTIFSLDALDYYPSVHLKLVKKAIWHCARDLPPEVKDTITMALKLIEFGMASTAMAFQDQHYICDGSQTSDDTGLSIGAHESAWSADLVGSYILEQVETTTTLLIPQETPLNGHCHNDGLMAKRGCRSYHRTVAWLDQFQSKVNEIAEGTHLQCECELWIDPNRRRVPRESTLVK